MFNKSLRTRRWEIEEIAWDMKGNVQLEWDKNKKDMRQRISEISSTKEIPKPNCHFFQFHEDRPWCPKCTTSHLFESAMSLVARLISIPRWIKPDEIRLSHNSSKSKPSSSDGCHLKSFFLLFKHWFHILYFPNSTRLSTKPTSHHYTKYQFSLDIALCWVYLHGCYFFCWRFPENYLKNYKSQLLQCETDISVLLLMYSNICVVFS